MENEFQNSAQQSGENQINKKKSPLPIVIAIAVILIAVVSICYFAFFSEAAMRDREIKNLIASAEKYLDDLDYENAIAEYEAVLKLNPKAEDVLDDYVGTVLAYSKEVAETDPEEAADILSDAAEFLDKISDGDKDIEKQIEELEKAADEYQAEADAANNTDDNMTGDNAGNDTSTGDDGSDDNLDGERSDILPYEQDGYIIFGAYEQDGDLTNGPEPIEWEVLGTDENGTLLVSRYILDCQPYNTEDSAVTWETCSLRAWLNDDFLNTAFTPSEQAVITTTAVVNADNSEYGTPGGNSTTDKIFCLSVDEILNHYTFNSYYDKWNYGFSMQLIIPPTQYAKDQGVYSEVISENKEGEEEEELHTYAGLAVEGYTRDCIGREGGWWWLRSPGYDNNYVCGVCVCGYTGENFDNYVSIINGVRPALYIAQ